jgi:hypothetical protein
MRQFKIQVNFHPKNEVMNCQILHGDSRKTSELPFKELEEGKLGIYNVLL